MRGAALALALLVPTAAHQSASRVPSARKESPLVGSWQLNTSRSHYGAGVERRRRERMTCTAVANGLRCVVESTRADGRVLTGRFTASFDGSIAPVTGIPDV